MNSKRYLFFLFLLAAIACALLVVQRNDKKRMVQQAEEGHDSGIEESTHKKSKELYRVPVTRSYEEAGDGTDESEKKIRFLHHNGRKSYELTTNDGVDRLATWYENGQLAIDAEILNGKRHGKIITWHDNGQKAEEGSYDHGLKHGKFVTWLEDGRKWEKSQYSRGKRAGTVVLWDGEGRRSELLVQQDREDRSVPFISPSASSSAGVSSSSANVTTISSEIDSAQEVELDSTGGGTKNSFASKSVLDGESIDVSAQQAPAPHSKAAISANPKSIVDLPDSTSIDDIIQVVYSNVRFNRRDNTLRVKVRLINVSPDELVAPFYFSLSNFTLSEVEIANADGETAATGPFFIIDDNLSPGGSTAVDIVFTNTGLRRFTFDPASFKVNILFTIDSPENLLVTNNNNENSIDVSGRIAPNITSVSVNGVIGQVTGETYLAANIPITEGNNSLTANGGLENGLIARAKVLVTLDTVEPDLRISSPTDNAFVIENRGAIRVLYSDANGID